MSALVLPLDDELMRGQVLGPAELSARHRLWICCEVRVCDRLLCSDALRWVQAQQLFEEVNGVGSEAARFAVRTQRAACVVLVHLDNGPPADREALHLMVVTDEKTGRFTLDTSSDCHDAGVLDLHAVAPVRHVAILIVPSCLGRSLAQLRSWMLCIVQATEKALDEGHSAEVHETGARVRTVSGPSPQASW